MATLRDIEEAAHGRFPNHRLDPNLVLRWIRDEYQRIHRERLIPTTINTSTAMAAQTTTWSSGASHDPSSDLSNWRGKPAFIRSADEDAMWVKVPLFDCMKRRVQCDLGTTGQQYAISALDGNDGRAYAISDDSNLIVVPYAITAGTVLYIYHFEEPSALRDDDDVVLLVNGTEQVLVSYVQLQGWLHLESVGVSVSRSTIESAREEYYRDMANVIEETDHESVDYARQGGQIFRLVKNFEVGIQQMRA